MQINPYLFYDSNCEAAFKFYEKALGGKIEMMMRNEDAPEGCHFSLNARRKSCTRGFRSRVRC